MPPPVGLSLSTSQKVRLGSSSGSLPTSLSSKESQGSNRPKEASSSKPEVPVAEEVDDTIVNGSISGVASKKKKKKVRKLKRKSKFVVGANGNREVLNTKSRIPPMKSGKIKSKATVKRSKSKKIKSYSRSKISSSTSSLDINPAQNAAFLRKYYEESTRLANKISSEELISEEPSPPVEESVTSTKRRKRKIKSKAPGSLAASTKPSKRSPPKPSKVSLRPSTTLPSSVSSVKKEGSKLEVNKGVYEGLGKQTQRPTTSISRSGSKINKSSTVINKRKKIVSVKSSTSVKDPSSDLPKSILSSDAKNRDNTSRVLGSAMRTADPSKSSSLDLTTLPPVVTFAVPSQEQVSPMPGTSSQKPEQFKTVDDMLNSKFSTVSTKMKSIWEKTPYQPMTHARFKDMVSKYASPEAQEAYAQLEEGRQPSQHSTKFSNLVPATYSVGSSPGTLLSLPKPWEIKEKLAEEANRDKTLKQLQGPPSYWPDSKTASVYTRINFLEPKSGGSFQIKGNQGAELRNWKKEREEASKIKGTTPISKNENLGNSRKGVGVVPPKEMANVLKMYKTTWEKER